MLMVEYIYTKKKNSWESSYALFSDYRLWNVTQNNNRKMFYLDCVCNEQARKRERLSEKKNFSTLAKLSQRKSNN